MFRGILGRIGALLALTLATQVQAGGNAAPESTPVSVPAPAEKGAHTPGFSRAIMELVSPDESEKAIWSRSLGKLNEGVPPLLRTDKGRKTSALRINGDTAPSAPASIAELARALRGNPDLIYEYVRNNIEYLPYWGVKKGEFGALLDNQGTAFDQAALMVALLRQSGYTANFVKGRVSLNAAQVKEWLGTDPARICGVLNLLGNAQIPTSSVVASAAGSCPGSAASLVSLKLDHVWVKVTIGGSSYVFDPSYKPHTQISGIDVAAVSGYNAANFMSSATTGATITPDYVQGINRNNVRGNLTSYANNLATYLRANKPAATLDDVLGGSRIVPYSGAALRQASLPYQDTSVALTEWTDIPANYKSTLRLQYQGIDRTFTSDAIYGHRLTITYNGSNQPVLSLDGSALATGTAISPGTYANVSMTVTHGAYANTRSNQAFTQQIKSGGTFVIGNGWGPAGRGIIDLHRGKLDQAMAGGAAAGSEEVLGSSLAVLSSSWIGQMNQSAYITDRLARTVTLFHHQVGIAGYNTAAYVDLPGNMLSVVSPDVNRDTEAAVFFSTSMHASVFESTAVQQTTGGSAVSTVKLIDQAVVANDRIYDAKSANFASAVQPNLQACSPWLPTFQAAVNAGRRLILPARCNLTEGSWSGAAFYNILVSTNSWSFGAIIGGGLAGGFSSTPMPATTTASNTRTNTVSPRELKSVTGTSIGDPIDLSKGSFIYEHEDLLTGLGGFPVSLSFSRSYVSSSRLQDGPVGRGWTHNLTGQLSLGSDGFQAMGEDSGLDAVGAIAEKLVSYDLLRDASKPVSNMVIASLGQRWLSEQLTNNTANVKMGANGEVFVRLPDGGYNSPPGSSVKLVRNGDGSHTYETGNKVVLNYDAAGVLTTYTQPSGIQAKFSYAGGLLSQVTNSLGRSLTLSYSNGRVSSVTDGVRTVTYAYDASGNLSTFRNALNYAFTYEYDLPGRMTKHYYPANPGAAVISNVYDSLGRVQTQTNANGKLFTYYFAGSRTEEVGPYGQSKVSYLDAHGKVLKAIDPLGRATSNQYDGQLRLVKTTLPEGNGVEYEYDDAPCAAQLRCTHNVKIVRELAKPGSGLAPLTVSSTYESNFNRVASVTDRLGRTSSYTYTAQGNQLTVTAPPDAQGNQPLTTYGYTSYNVSGFPSFYLQTSVTSRISPTESVTSQLTYNAANKYVQQSAVADAGPGKLNLTTTFTYDAIGNLIQTDGPRSDVSDISTTVYDAQRQPVQTTNAAGKVTRLSYDAEGKPVRSASQVGSQWLVSCKSYTPTDKLLKAWGPSLQASDSSCPAAAAPVGVTDYVYDDLDRVVRVTENLPAGEGGNRVTETIYNLDDSIQETRRATGTALAQSYARYTYTANGKLATIKDANGNLTTYLYDGRDRKVKTQYPDKTAIGTSSSSDAEQYTYDDNGNLTSQTRRNGQTIGLAYDGLGRLVSKTYAAAADNVGFEYDLLSRRTAVRFADGSHDIRTVYDNAGRVSSNTAAGKTLSYQYDAAGNAVRVTWPEATPFFVTTEYDALNRPLVVKELGSASLASYAYDDLSRRSTVTLGNGTVTSFSYSNENALSGLAHNLSGSAQDIAWNFGRNQVNEITSHSWSNDLYQWSGYSNGNRSYAVNGLNQYTNAAGATLSYDLNGNITGDGVWTYGYDADNRLRTAAKAGLAATLAYDPLGRLFSTTIGGNTVRLLYSGSALAAEYDAAGNLLRRYVPGPGGEPLLVYEGPVKTWLYTDQMGSVVAGADAAGNATASYTYGPYGEPGGAAGVRLRYTGHQFLSELGLYYYRARIYSPALARFLQTDPAEYSDDLNLYAYVGNDPLNAVDPSGLGKVSAADLVAAGVNGTRDFVDGGYGTLTSQAIHKGEYGYAAMYTVAGALYSFGNIVTFGQEGAIIAGARSMGTKALASGEQTLAKLNPCKCFAAGTPVHTKDGLKPIEDVEVGDLIAARNEADGQTAWKPVLSLIRHEERDFVRLHYADDEGREEALVVTVEHPFMLDSHRWVQAGDVKVGDRIVRLDGNVATVSSLAKLEENRSTYNFEVADFHTYFVGTQGVWAHNACDITKVVQEVEQYALRAKADGWYPVMKRGAKDAVETVWLQAGEVWKFGTTKNPKVRYSQTYLDSIGPQGVNMVKEFGGSLKEAIKVQNMKIINFLEQKGVLPPGNKVIN